MGPLLKFHVFDLVSVIGRWGGGGGGVGVGLGVEGPSDQWCGIVSCKSHRYCTVRGR